MQLHYLPPYTSSSFLPGPIPANFHYAEVPNSTTSVEEVALRALSSEKNSKPHAKRAHVEEEGSSRPDKVRKGISALLPSQRFFQELPAKILEQLQKTRNTSFVIQKIEKISDFKLKSYEFHIDSASQEKRTVIFNPQTLLEKFFALIRMQMPGIARLKHLLIEITRHNETFQSYPHSENKNSKELVSNHSELRLLLFFYQCVAFNGLNAQNDKIHGAIHWGGAQIQLFAGSYPNEAAHHALLAHLEDSCLKAIKSQFYDQLKDAIRGDRPLDPHLVIQVISLGVKSDVLEEQYRAVLSNESTVEKAVDKIFENCVHRNLLDQNSLFYFINNHTLIEDAHVNRLDDLIDENFRIEATELLVKVSKKEITPHDAALQLSQRMSEYLQDLPKRLNVLKQSLTDLVRIVHCFMDTQFFPQNDLNQKIQIIKNFSTVLKQLNAHISAIDVRETYDLRKIYNAIYKQRYNSHIIPTVTYDSIQELILECDQFLEEKEKLSVHKKTVEECQSEINKILHYSKKRIQGIEDIKIRQGDLQQYIRIGDLKAVEKHKEYDARIDKINQEEKQEQSKLKQALAKKAEAEEAIMKTEKVLNEGNDSKFKIIIDHLLEAAPLMEQYRDISFVHEIDAVSKYIEPQLAGLQQFQKTMLTFPPPDSSDYQSLQSLLIARNAYFPRTV